MRGGTKKAKKLNSPARSVMGQLLPPVDVRDTSSLNELDKRIAIGPVTLVLVYADWCGHCQRFKPQMSQLENMSGRSVQVARVRDDVFPKSNLSKNKISGYPSLMLVKQNGEAISFKEPNGEITNAIPDYKNMSNMSSIVKNAGTPKGLTLLEPTAPSGPMNIVSDRLPANQVNNLNTTLMKNTKENLVRATKQPLLGGGQSGGNGLWNSLWMASNQLAPAAALFLGASVLNRKRKTRKVRGTRRRI